MNTQIHARERFLVEYAHIRHAEGRGSDNPAYYQALPYQDISGRSTSMWAMRARTYRHFETRILAAIEKRSHSPLRILDLGAGNAWLSYRLTLRGHTSVALDIFSDERDGLRAARHYPCPISTVEADFDHLPFGSESFDLILYNSSIHYSTDYTATLREARRCLRKGGRVVILDSPVYPRAEDGRQMVAARHASFLQQYGFRSDAIASIEYLDKQTVNLLGNSLKIDWTIYRPWYGFQWHLRPLRAFLANRRRPSSFWILVGSFGA